MTLRIFIDCFNKRPHELIPLQIPSVSPSLLFFSSLVEKLESLAANGTSLRTKELKVLLADDDVDDREMFEEAITKINPLIKVNTLMSGLSLIGHLEKGDIPDMIFLDLNMPGKNGKECLRDIRKNPSWMKIPVVIYSTSTNKRDIDDTYSGGANLYLLKPTSFQELIKIIKRVFTIDLEAKRIPQHEYLLTNCA